MTQGSSSGTWAAEVAPRRATGLSLSALRPKWEDVRLEIADVMSTRSLCTRAKVGAVIVTNDNRVQAVSYNGPPPGMMQSRPCVEWCPRARALESGNELHREYEDCFASHAEINAIARADSTQLDDATIFVNGSVCMMCAKAISATKISTVVMRVNETDAHRAPDDVISFLKRCRVTVVVVSAEKSENV